MKFINLWRHEKITVKTLFFTLKTFISEHRSLVMYVIFGCLTTLIDWTISFILYRTPLNVHVVNIIAWTAAVLFAFFTNRKCVFGSERKGFFPVLLELFSFAGSRLLSLGIQELLFFIAVDMLDIKKQIVKIPVAVIVVIINYILGKLVFKKREKTETTADTAEISHSGGGVVISDHADEKEQ